MKSILSATAIALVLVGAVSTNHAKTTPKASPVAMKSAAPVPSCPWNSPDGCGIMNF
jgi:hypothetical protein